MKKLLLGFILCLFLCSQALAVTGDQISVSIKIAKYAIGTTTLSDSLFLQWANDGYQKCMTLGLARTLDTTIIDTVGKYRYKLPSTYYMDIGAMVLSGTPHNLKSVPFGQQAELGQGTTGDINFYSCTKDSIDFYFKPAKVDTIRFRYYAIDKRYTAVTDTLKIDATYSDAIADFILYRYYERDQNLQMSDRFWASFISKIQIQGQMVNQPRFEIFIKQKVFER
jgi:hypothetical protein